MTVTPLMNDGSTELRNYGRWEGLRCFDDLPMMPSKGKGTLGAPYIRSLAPISHSRRRSGRETRIAVG